MDFIESFWCDNGCLQIIIIDSISHDKRFSGPVWLGTLNSLLVYMYWMSKLQLNQCKCLLKFSVSAAQFSPQNITVELWPLTLMFDPDLDPDRPRPGRSGYNARHGSSQMLVHIMRYLLIKCSVLFRNRQNLLFVSLIISFTIWVSWPCP